LARERELGYHHEFVRGIGEMEWISCQTFSVRAYTGIDGNLSGRDVRDVDGARS
jgi:hypothetical protein